MTQRNEFLHDTALSVRETRRAKVRQSEILSKAIHDVKIVQQAFWNAQSQAAGEASAGERALQNYRLLTPKEIERLRKEVARKLTASQKVLQRCYAEVNLKNAQLEDQIVQLENLLKATLSIDDYLDIRTLRANPQIPQYVAPYIGIRPTKPDPQAYIPPQLTGIKKLIPSLKELYRKEYAAARERYKQDFERYRQHMLAIKQKIESSKEAYKQQVNEIQMRTKTHNIQISHFQREFEEGQPEAIIDYFMFVLEASGLTAIN